MSLNLYRPSTGKAIPIGYLTEDELRTFDDGDVQGSEQIALAAETYILIDFGSDWRVVA